MKRALLAGLSGLGLLTAGLVHRSGGLDREPPTVVIELPAGPLSGDIPVLVTVTDSSPGLATASLQVDDGPPVELAMEPRGPSTWSTHWTWTGGGERPSGEHTLTVRASDHAWRPNTVQQSIQRTTDDQSPVLRYLLVPETPAQGTAAAVFVWSDEELDQLSFTGLDQARPLRALPDGVHRALVGVAVSAAAGPTPLHLTATDALGNSTECRVSVDVAATQFARGGTIRLSSSQVKARRDTEALRAMREARTAAYTFVDPDQHWRGGTTRPVQGRRTSPFGRYRTYSDGRQKHHLGTDLANITGTPVLAALDGVVRAAGWQHLFGNAVIVHHGHGLTTSYNHLSAIEVELGERVEAGQVVGKLGSTGQSTGPHLHWGMQVGEVEIDPERWPAHGFSPDALALEESSALACAPVEPPPP